MFYTLTLTVQKKINGRYTKTYSHLPNDLKKFQAECNNNPQSDFKGLGCVIQANTEELYLIFVGNGVGYLERLQDALTTLIQCRAGRYNEQVVYHFTFGKIIQNALGNLENSKKTLDN